MRSWLAVLAIILGNLAPWLGAVQGQSSPGQPPSSHDPCVAEATHYHGWEAERLANRWVTLTIVPQLGGRLLQVEFGSHQYLFVNPQYLGQYFPPEPRKWFNYGGDKIWPLPEGNQDERHWAGGSDTLDDGVYKLQVLAQGETCAVRLDGPPDERTGLQYEREISLGADS